MVPIEAWRQMASADDAGGYDCARPVGVVAGAGQVGAVGLVGSDERCAQEFHLDGVGVFPPWLVREFADFAVAYCPAVKGWEVFCFGRGCLYIEIG